MIKMLENYEAALQRLILNKPTHPKLINTKYKINKATVALEAGRDPSSIRNENPEFDVLRIKIKQAEIARKSLNANGDKHPPKQLKVVIKENKDEYKDLDELLNDREEEQIDIKLLINSLPIILKELEMLKTQGVEKKIILKELAKTLAGTVMPIDRELILQKLSDMVNKEEIRVKTRLVIRRSVK